MTDRDRLVKLLIKTGVTWNPCGVADAIIADGWIKPACKVGDTVYVPKDNGEISKSKVSRIDVTFMMNTNKKPPFDIWWLNEYNIGVTSFLAREEAEKALERSKRNEQFRTTESSVI